MIRIAVEKLYDEYGIGIMKIVDLKRELQARGLSVTGVKKILVERLIESIENKEERDV